MMSSHFKNAILTVFAILLLTLCPSGFAAPTSITIQGKLTNAAGRPLTGARVWRVTFFSAATGGTALGAPLTGTVTVAATGRFAIELVPPAAALDSATPYYELAIDSAPTPDGVINASDVFPGRVKVTSVMVAQRLARTGSASGLDADLLDGLHAAAFVTTASLASQLTAITRPLAWQTITTSTAAQPNCGYLVNNPTAMATLSLPQSPAVGDIVRVSGVGAGGWKIVSPIIVPKFPLLPYLYTIRLDKLNLAGDFMGSPLYTSSRVIGIGISPDGSALAIGIYGGSLSVNTSGGAPGAWTSVPSSTHYWSDTALSTDGTFMAACSTGGTGFLFTSADKGATWDPHETSVTHDWKRIAISSDGTRLAAVAFNEYLYTSANGGANWAPRTANGTHLWTDVAISANGGRIAACAQDGAFFLSTDGGTQWNQSTIPGASAITGLAMSPDGMHLAAGTLAGTLESGSLYLSSDGGATWTECKSAGSHHWTDAALTSDGMRLAACYDGSNGKILLSDDGGISWSIREANVNQPWTRVAMDANGHRLIASNDNGGIWVTDLPPRFTSTDRIKKNGYISGGPGSAIELQYIGNNTFQPLSSIGTFNAN